MIILLWLCGFCQAVKEFSQETWLVSVVTGNASDGGGPFLAGGSMQATATSAARSSRRATAGGSRRAAAGGCM